MNSSKLNIQLIEHRDISDVDLLKIIQLKTQHWKYSIDEQIRWINTNMQENDYHLKIETSRNEIIAYLNLVNCEVYLANECYKMLGIGNVCVDKSYQGQNYGHLLMDICRFYLLRLRKTGLLLCKEKLIPFYSSSNWIKFNNEVFIGDTAFHDFLFFSNKKHIESLVLKLSRAF